MWHKYFLIVICGYAAVVYLFRLAALLSKGRLFAGIRLLSGPPNRMDLAFCYLAMILLLANVVGRQGGWW